MPDTGYDAETGTWIAPPTYVPRQDPVARAYYERVHRLTRIINTRLGHSHPETEGGLLDAVDALRPNTRPDAEGIKTQAEDAAMFGVELPRSETADCIVLPVNWDAARAFLAASTQWRLGPGGELLGLDYAGARAAAKALGLRWRAVFGGLQIMEAEAARVMGERRDR